MANIYKITRADHNIGYDEYEAHVVVATNESFAKAICVDNVADESPDVWYAANIECIGEAYDEPSNGGAMVLSSFKAG